VLTPLTPTLSLWERELGRDPWLPPDITTPSQ
jgi:hypothetical protein